MSETSLGALHSRFLDLCLLIAMTMLFFVVVTPVGFFMRLACRDRLRLRFEPAQPSYWLPRISRSGPSMAKPR